MTGVYDLVKKNDNADPLGSKFYWIYLCCCVLQVMLSRRRCLTGTAAWTAVRSSTTGRMPNRTGCCWSASQHSRTVWWGSCSCTAWSARPASPLRGMQRVSLVSRWGRRTFWLCGPLKLNFWNVLSFLSFVDFSNFKVGKVSWLHCPLKQVSFNSLSSYPSHIHHLQVAAVWSIKTRLAAFLSLYSILLSKEVYGSKCHYTPLLTLPLSI